MLDVWGHSSSSHAYRSRRSSLSATSTSSSPRSNAETVSTVLSDKSQESSLDETFHERFPDIVEHWRCSSLTKHDYEYLSSLRLSEADYVTITEVYRLRHGIELDNYRLVLVEYPTATHEVLIRRLDRQMDRAYQDELLNLGSTGQYLPSDVF